MTAMPASPPEVAPPLRENPESVRNEEPGSPRESSSSGNCCQDDSLLGMQDALDSQNMEKLVAVLNTALFLFPQECSCTLKRAIDYAFKGTYHEMLVMAGNFGIEFPEIMQALDARIECNDWTKKCVVQQVRPVISFNRKNHERVLLVKTSTPDSEMPQQPNMNPQAASALESCVEKALLGAAETAFGIIETMSGQTAAGIVSITAGVENLRESYEHFREACILNNSGATANTEKEHGACHDREY